MASGGRLGICGVMAASLINVSNRLPVTLVGETKSSGPLPEIRKSSGGLVTGLEGLPADQYSVSWVGWPGSDVPEARRAEIEAVLRHEHGCQPVFIPSDLAEAYYEGLANSSIWPLLHYLPSYLRYQSGWWDAYVQANRLFAQKILSLAQDGELVWVHDYQLMLLPKMLKEANPSLRVGFFLHTPFPSSDVFRCHPNREALLEGMLGADLCGFHTFGYLRQFRSSVANLLGASSEMATVRYQGESTRLGVYPIGIPSRKFERELSSPEFIRQFQKLAAENRGKRLVLSVERLDYTKGIIPRLEAIELFLSRLEAGARDTVKFIFIAIPTREGVDEYRQLRQKVETRVGAINGRFASLQNSPVHFIHGSVGFTELCALYAVADVAMVTPLRDGLNLVAKEYVACQREIVAGGEAAAGVPGAPEVASVRATPGVLILSEFTGAAEELFSAIIVNPNDVHEVANALATALAMEPAERRRRMIPMRYRVMDYDAAAWATDFVNDLNQPPPPPAAPLRLTPPGQLAEAQSRLRAAVELGKSVALFLDYDGTVRELVRDPHTARPTPEVAQLLERLCEPANVDVTVISGRTTEDLERFLRHPRCTLIAEHGAAMRPAGAATWERLDQNLTYEWKDRVWKILRQFERVTPGTHIEDKSTSLVWHYRRADNEFGEWKARRLIEGLGALAANDALEVRHGRHIVEVVSMHVSKGTAVLRVLQQKKYDLIVVAGDDVTDESMFGLDLPEESTITVRVGPGATRARYRVAHPRALRRFLVGAMDPVPA